MALAIGAFSISSYAQVDIQDNFDSYNLGDISSQSDHWRTWSGAEGGDEDADVVSAQSQTAPNSMLIPGNEITDQILLCPYAADSGFYTVQFAAYIPAGKSGYFNMQAALTPDGVAWEQALMGGNVYFNCDGASAGSGGVTGVIDCTAFDQSFTYPEDQWFTVKCVYDIDVQMWNMYIDGTQVVTDYPFAFGDQIFSVLAGIDFYSASPNNEMYIDDVLLYIGELGTDDFAANSFSVYPNPVQDVLNIETKAAVDNVTVYDILGKVVLSNNPGTISPRIDMSGLSSGAYLVKVTIGDASKTVKVLK
jgi:hypothetical protein